ncbi:hypothetical protein [Pseudomonas siliginis]|uniref:hypothetical protein n=1 Tax=Pseudomonas siliginis TaxID=2842346 RepID=UPI0020921FBB|nr:hypothetical protein [Pseudomonas siliginis]UST80148.1 hypothetical protein NF676_02170 [Pseudomonas siliginis]
MEWFKLFSNEYANGVTAVAASLALLLTALTLLSLKREYRAKYRPYIVPAVAVDEVEKEPGQITLVTSIHPRNVGPHPCWIKISDIKLVIGDEVIDTITTIKEWSLIGTQGASVAFPSGEIFPIGIQRIRENFYQVNRIELHFTSHTKSIDDDHKSSQRCLFVIEIRGLKPIAMYRPDLLTVSSDLNR